MPLGQLELLTPGMQERDSLGRLLAAISQLRNHCQPLRPLRLTRIDNRSQHIAADIMKAAKLQRGGFQLFKRGRSLQKSVVPRRRIHRHHYPGGFSIQEFFGY